jgi:hypothetical protein
MTRTMTYGVFAAYPALSWPMKEPDAIWPYSQDLSAWIGTGTVTELTMAISPAGELSAANLLLSGSIATVTLSGGIPGRRYIAKFDGAMATGDVFSVLVGIVCDPTLAAWPLPDASDGFGDPIIYQPADDANFVIVGG